MFTDSSIPSIIGFMYRATIRACYIGNFVGALVSNLAPLLYMLFINEFGITFEQAGRLTLINFFTQIIADLAFSRPVARYGLRQIITPALPVCGIDDRFIRLFLSCLITRVAAQCNHPSDSIRRKSCGDESAAFVLCLGIYRCGCVHHRYAFTLR